VHGRIEVRLLADLAQGGLERRWVCGFDPAGDDAPFIPVGIRWGAGEGMYQFSD